MNTTHILKHLRVLFTLLFCLFLLGYGGWLVIQQFNSNTITKPMLKQAQQAQVDFEADIANPASSNANNADSTNSAVSVDAALPISSLTAMDLLNVEEVINSAYAAVRYANDDALLTLHQRLIDTATQININPDELDFIRSEQALQFMRFRAKRAWFKQEVELRYYTLKSLDGLLAQFPEAKGELYHQSVKLIIDRDLIIFNMAKAIAEAQDRAIVEADITSAQQQWQAAF